MKNITTITGELFSDAIIECVDTFYVDCDFIGCELVGLWCGYKNCNFIDTKWRVRHSFYHDCAVTCPGSLSSYRVHNFTVGANVEEPS